MNAGSKRERVPLVTDAVRTKLPERVFHKMKKTQEFINLRRNEP